LASSCLEQHTLSRWVAEKIAFEIHTVTLAFIGINPYVIHDSQICNYA
jgi:hypothetical protein